MNGRAANLFLLTSISLGLFLVAGCGQAVVPKEFKTYVAEDQSFKCDAPSGWGMTGGGKNSNYNATFSSGGASISITFDVTGSVLADIAKNNNRMGGTDDVEELTPLMQMHAMNASVMAEELSNFKDLNTADIKLPISGEAKKSEFTGSGSLGGKRHGYRVTSLLTSQRLTIICECPEDEWKRLQPVFDRVINSVAHGG